MDEIISGNNVYFHCRIGADRTGTMAYLLEGLLGVPNEYRYEDYELTSVAGINDRTRYYDQKSDTNFYKFLYMMGYTLTTQDIYDWYMAGSQDLTADIARIANFRNAMTYTPPNNQSPNNSPSNTNSLNSNVSSHANNFALNINTTESSDTSSESTTNSDIYDSYDQPLGSSSNPILSDNSASLALAAAAVASGSLAAYTFAKIQQLKKETDEEEA